MMVSECVSVLVKVGKSEGVNIPHITISAYTKTLTL